MPLKKSVLQNFEVRRDLHGKRIDTVATVLWAKSNPGKSPVSRAFLRTLIENGKILLNQKSVRPSTHVRLRDTVTFLPEESSQENVHFSSPLLSIEKIYEDENILAIYKPACISMHRATKHHEPTIADWVLHSYPELKKVGEDALRPGIVHRLDKETSGVIVIAKNNTSFKALKELFQKRQMIKKYITLVYGNLREKSGEINYSLTRRSGELKRKALVPRLENQKLSHTVRPALTLYRVLRRYKNFDLLEVAPKTGRTHQIRVHLSALGHPVVGDKLYAFKPAKRGDLLFSERHLLHAHTLSFSLFGKKYELKAPLPSDFRQFLQDIDETSEAGYDDKALKSL